MTEAADCRAPDRGAPFLSSWRVNLVATGLLTLALLGAGSAGAAEADDSARTGSRENAADERRSAANAEGPTKAGGSQTAKGADADEDDGGFIPSEEISEDFAVSFPVDI